MSTDADGTPVRPAQETEDGYRAVFRGLVVDTLSGRSQFGHIIDPRTGQLNWIIEFITADDFAGGMFIASPTADLPSEERYGISADALDDPDGNNLALVYRHGLYRVFRARSGTISFSHISDTLVSGSFDAVLLGEVAERGREAIRGEAEVSGTFSARSGNPGYVIGL